MSARPIRIDEADSHERRLECRRPLLYLFLDTETTGVPRSRSAPPAAIQQWPRLVQIAWAAYGEAGNWVAMEAHLVYPAGFAIPAAAIRIHGISTARAE